MNESHFNCKTIFKIIISFLLALILTVLPLPSWLNWMHPQWIVLVLMYWTLTFPYTIGIVVAWLVGIFLDVLYNTAFGEHALALVILSYFLIRFHARINFFSVLQKTLVILGLLLMYQFLIIICELLMGKPVVIWMYLLSALISAIFWPYLAIF